MCPHVQGGKRINPRPWTSQWHRISKSWHTDWVKCCLCQMDTKECLISPRSNPTKGADDGYGLLARNIPQFHSVNQLPIKLDPARLDDGSGIQETLKTNHAQYHASCRILFNNTKSYRAQKRKRPTGDGDESNSSSNKIPRRGSTPQKAECFLCKEEGGEVREAMIMKLNTKVNECAKTISDGKLLAKLSAGDVVAQELKYHPTCLVALYTHERAHLHEMKELKKTEEMKRNAAYSTAFSELVTYITETKVACESSNPSIFRLCVCSTERGLSSLALNLLLFMLPDWRTSCLSTSWSYKLIVKVVMLC